MGEIRFEVVGGERELEDWRYVHNVIIPVGALSLDEVRERVRRNRLEVAYLDGVLVGCSTVRPPGGETVAATVIARVLPEYRRRGVGAVMYARGLEYVRTLGDEVDAVETVVLASNEDGLRFALAHGFVEVERYVLPGDSIPYVTLRARLERWSGAAGGGSDHS